MPKTIETTEIPNILDYSVAAIKSFIGEEGHGFSATLVRDGKKVATLVDSANGGPVKIQWLDHEQGRDYECPVKNRDGSVDFLFGTRENALFAAMVMAQPDNHFEMSPGGKKFTSPANADGIVTKIVETQENLNRLSNRMKRVVLTLENDQIVTYTPKKGQTFDSIFMILCKRYKVLNILPEREFRSIVMGKMVGPKWRTQA